MKEYWVSSDHHFFHKKILEYQACTRPFDSIEEHNEELIKRHNSLVKPTDEVYFLGDLAFTKNILPIKEIFERLNGVIHFNKGNHDHNIHWCNFSDVLASLEDYREFKLPYKINGKKLLPIVMSHYPILSWNRQRHGSLHFYGHTHGQIPELPGGRARDVGIDTSNCYPLNINEIALEMSKNEIVDNRHE